MAVNVLLELKERLQTARSVAVLTGAGISADSGVPTFRGQDGLWRNFRAEDLATPDAFSRDPRLVWEWYDWRRGRRSEEHTSELQSQSNLVCRLLLETKNTITP